MLTQLAPVRERHKLGYGKPVISDFGGCCHSQILGIWDCIGVPLSFCHCCISSGHSSQLLFGFAYWFAEISEVSTSAIEILSQPAPWQKPNY